MFCTCLPPHHSSHLVLSFESPLISFSIICFTSQSAFRLSIHSHGSRIRSDPPKVSLSERKDCGGGLFRRQRACRQLPRPLQRLFRSGRRHYRCSRVRRRKFASLSHLTRVTDSGNATTHHPCCSLHPLCSYDCEELFYKNGITWPYGGVLLSSLKAAVERNRDVLSEKIDVDAALAATSFAEFDSVVSGCQTGRPAGQIHFKAAGSRRAALAYIHRLSSCAHCLPGLPRPG
jgi:hypothetical protein